MFWSFVASVGASIGVGIGTGFYTGSKVNKRSEEKAKGKELKMQLLRIKKILMDLHTTEIFKKSDKTMEELLSIRHAIDKLKLEQYALEIIDEKAKEQAKIKDVLEANENFCEKLKKACADSGYYNPNLGLKALKGDQLRELNELKSLSLKCVDEAIIAIQI